MALGSLFRAFSRGYPLVQLDYVSFVTESTESRPLIFVWGEKTARGSSTTASGARK